VKNPYAYMAKADVFVLSSAWEGLPNVLIEALAVGVPVVATDCPSGPREILHGGQYGWLTPVANPQAMAEAILKVLDGEVKLADAAWLDQFTLQTSVQKYLDLLKIPDSDRDYS
jgi:glycosyltransferase involved in cell wall biosynthesis